MERWSGKVAIVTGASSGIGAVTVEGLVKDGLKVIGLARRVERVRELADKLKNEKGRLYPFECDVSQESDIIRAYEWIEKEFGGVDVLINNAGVVSGETIIDGKTETFRRIFDVNALAFAICSREAIKSMRNRDVDGHIIVVNSILGHDANAITIPTSVYSASKYAVTAMTMTLRNELAAIGSNIKITSVSPGLVATEMPLVTGCPPEILELPICLRAKDVSDAIIYALGTPPNVLIRELIIEPLKRYK